MKILFTTYYPEQTGGAEISLALLMRELKNRGHEIYLASTEEYKGIETFLFKKFKKMLFFGNQENYVVGFVSKIIKDKNIELVHANDRLTTIGALKAAKKNEVKSVVHFRDYWFASPNSSCLTKDYKEYGICTNKLIMKNYAAYRAPWEIYKLSYLRKNWKTLGEADLKIVISNHLRNKLAMCEITKNIYNIPNPINLNLSKSDKENFKEENKLKKIVVAYAGSLTYTKGILNILDVMINIIKENKDISFLIAGDGELKNQVLSKIKKNNLKDNIILKKFTHTEMNDVYSNSDIIIIIPN